jgi:D-glycero-D-manno-heptose 1,7-bisphosphate phosphatase
MRASRTVFLDRDGVVNRKRDGDYVRDWTEFEFLDGSREALRLLAEGGCRVIVVTNQRGVARGFFTEADLAVIHERMIDETNRAGGKIAAVYYCPHEIGQCLCRKPEPGLFLEAQRDFPDIDFPLCTVIGDSSSDLEAGAALGCRTIFIGASDRHRSAATLHQAVVTFLVNESIRPGV